VKRKRNVSRAAVAWSPRVQQDIARLVVPPGTRVSLRRDRDPADTTGFTRHAEAEARLRMGVERLAAQQDRLWAQNSHAVLIVLQAMDAAGKDSVIEHVFSGVNPTGCHVSSFKVPSEEELDHDFLWRAAKQLPQRGQIGVFNRSYYEDVLVTRVHPRLLDAQRLPSATRRHGLWRRRFQAITAFERHLADSGTLILKFFLHVSKAEQKRRFLERIDQHEKNWKFSLGDVHERAHWDDYMRAYEHVFRHTSTAWAPWFIVPADHKWYARAAVCATILTRLQELQLHFPKLTAAHRRELEVARELLLAEGTEG
jgi:PPK2 family polyphosphate:nucleotide phosphotransferase